MQDRAREAVLRSDLTSAAEILNIDQVRSGEYPESMDDAHKGQGLPASADTEYQYRADNSAEPPTFCLTGINGMVALYITQEGVVGEGVCEGDYSPIAGGGSGLGTVFVFDTTAPGCTGTVQLPVSLPSSGGTIDWGDGVIEPRSDSLMAHTYNDEGIYTAVYNGPIAEASYYSLADTIHTKCLTRVDRWSVDAEPTKVNFHRASNLVYVAEPPRTVTDMSYMFSSATAFNQDIGNWDISRVTNMQAMFESNRAFNRNISVWNVNMVSNWDRFRNHGVLFNAYTPSKFR